MRDPIIFDTWEEFLAQPPSSGKPHPVYRGVADEKWGLETTLERIGRVNEPFEEYLTAVAVVKDALESYTEKRWVLEQVDCLKIKPEDLWHFKGLPNYEFLVYLRHHGFPSPFLDWSMSRYVAAFFALIDADPDKTERCAIYEFSACDEDGIRSFCGHKETPRICNLGHTIRAHKRHYMQQAEYTYCVKATDEAGLIFAPHSDGQGQYIKKYTLPTSERKKVLKSLQEMNITAYTLFGTEDSLIKMLTVDEYLIHNQRIPASLIRSMFPPVAENGTEN
jgi:hypothetical protein